MASAASADNKAAIAPSYEPVQYAIIPHWLVKAGGRNGWGGPYPCSSPTSPRQQSHIDSVAQISANRFCIVKLRTAGVEAPVARQKKLFV